MGGHEYKGELEVKGRRSSDYMTILSAGIPEDGRGERTAATAFRLDWRVGVFSFLQWSPDGWNL